MSSLTAGCQMVLIQNGQVEERRGYRRTATDEQKESNPRQPRFSLLNLRRLW